jgi:hypothetical protein
MLQRPRCCRSKQPICCGNSMSTTAGPGLSWPRGTLELEARVEGKPRVRPSQAARELLVDVGADALVADLQKPSGERLVVSDQPVTNLEDVQDPPNVDGQQDGEAIRPSYGSSAASAPAAS